MTALTKKHYSRLRWYWQGNGMAGSLTDGVDLDLAGLGLVERNLKSYGGTVQFGITKEGEVELYAERKRDIERRKL